MKCTFTQDPKVQKKELRLRGLRKRGRGTYPGDKPPIITRVCRKTGKVIFIVAKHLSFRLIRHLIRKHCKGTVTVYTDEYTIYKGLKNTKPLNIHFIYTLTVTHT